MGIRVRALRAKTLESGKRQSAEIERSAVTDAQVAEDRGFEPRRALPPNRIGSAVAEQGPHFSTCL
jgi:hypothetical protein